MPPASPPRLLRISFAQADVERMMTLVENTMLPEEPPFPEASSTWTSGMNLPWLKTVREQWLREFSVDEFERKLNLWPHYMALFDDENVDLHFVHAKSSKPDAIPLLLLHGWPGSSHDFHKVVEPLTNPSNPTAPSFHVVVPSIPGYAFSTWPHRPSFTIVDISNLYHRLMAETLGYNNYAVQGGDWGSLIARIMVSSPKIAPHVRIAHLNIYSVVPTSAQVIQALQALVPSFLSCIPGYTTLVNLLSSTLNSLLFTPAEQRGIASAVAYGRTGNGYFHLQSTKPLTIGYALVDSPVGLLAYMGDKFYDWSDPAHLDTRDLIETVALYYLTRSFHTSVLAYQLSHEVAMSLVFQPGQWTAAAGTAIGYSSYPYEIGIAPRMLVRGMGRVVMYKEHSYGGHFAALDNPTAFVKDLRELAAGHWAQ
ncbi:alpha/beta-hydrolase [Auricularia subglabra TFB-10046 SS5]|uniref:Alpha/beta-hydrolase n=1 Tax=Auricularia subglabra (strain TFB-10046 / SS5) TaxID=717982 RepID=J0WRG6_AURST|nr:alpha/beta-hydrolase [Auricularia subglabra TFB-10046 SS5]